MQCASAQHHQKIDYSNPHTSCPSRLDQIQFGVDGVDLDKAF